MRDGLGFVALRAHSLHNTLEIGQLLLLRGQEEFRVIQLRPELCVFTLGSFALFSRGCYHLQSVSCVSACGAEMIDYGVCFFEQSAGEVLELNLHLLFSVLCYDSLLLGLG